MWGSFPSFLFFWGGGSSKVASLCIVVVLMAEAGFYSIWKSGKSYHMVRKTVNSATLSSLDSYNYPFGPPHGFTSAQWISWEMEDDAEHVELARGTMRWRNVAGIVSLVPKEKHHIGQRKVHVGQSKPRAMHTPHTQSPLSMGMGAPLAWMAHCCEVRRLWVHMV